MSIEAILYQLSSWFLIPVLSAIVLAFVYAIYQSGRFIIEALYRYKVRYKSCPVYQIHLVDPQLDSEQLQLLILKELEGLRITARTAPLLGLVATMIPMGPALAGVAAGEMSLVGEQVGIAFAAVIVALLAASVCFILLTVKRRWRLMSLKVIEKQQEQSSIQEAA